MEVVGVRVEMPSNSPIVLLKEEQGDRYLPIWIGAVEATAIAFAQQGMVSLRPLTHDLFKDVLEVLNVQLRTVKITSLRDGIFYADLVFSNGAEVSARPSDSIALALRTGAAIFASDEILTRRAWRSPTSRRTRWRSSASSSTRFLPRTSASRRSGAGPVRRSPRFPGQASPRGPKESSPNGWLLHLIPAKP